MNLTNKRAPQLGEYVDNGIEKLIRPGVREEKVVILDFDFAAFKVFGSGSDEYGNKNPEYTEEDYPIVFNKVSELYYGIINTIEQHFDIKSIFMCVKGKIGSKSFRRGIYPTYKSKRVPPLPIIRAVHNYLVENFQAIEANNGWEADDTVATISKSINHQGIIIAEDKDLLQIPSIFYNPAKDTWKKVTEEESRYNLAIQCLIGDNSDGINLFPKTGIKTAEKIIKIGMTDYQYIKAILTYLKSRNYPNYKENLRIGYKLVKLHNTTKNDI